MRVFFTVFWSLVFAYVCTGTSLAQVKVQTYGSLPYVSGGVGLDEREALGSMSERFNLKLNFAVNKGNYLSDVAVVITDSTDHVILQATAQGPWFFTRLPAGTYTVTASTLGQNIKKPARLTAERQTELNFFWSLGY